MHAEPVVSMLASRTGLLSLENSAACSNIIISPRQTPTCQENLKILSISLIDCHGEQQWQSPPETQECHSIFFWTGQHSTLTATLEHHFQQCCPSLSSFYQASWWASTNAKVPWTQFIEASALWSCCYQICCNLILLSIASYHCWF